MIVAKYKFDKSIYENLIPVFNDGYNGYTVSDEIDSENSNYIIRTIECDTLPTMMRFGREWVSGETNTDSRTDSLLKILDMNTSELTSCNSMFRYNTNLTSINCNWDTSKVTNMNSMFNGCNNLVSLDVSNFNTNNVTNMYAMFHNCTNLTSIDVSNFNTSNVTNMQNMFYNCNDLTSLDVSNFDTKNVTNMANMFYNCNNLISLDVSNFNTSKVTSMYGMFHNCTNLTSIDVSNFNTSNVTNMRNMFYNCNDLTSLDVSNWDTSKVTTMEKMFNSCNNLTSLDVSNFNTSKVTSMYGMFMGCQLLTSLDLSNFDTSNAYMQSIFHSCEKLHTLDLSNWISINSSPYMFYNCSSLAYIKFNNIDIINSILNNNEDTNFPDRTGKSIGKIITTSSTNVDTTILSSLNWSVDTSSGTKIAEYKFDKSIWNSLIPEFNEGYGGYFVNDRIEDEVNSPNVVTRELVGYGGLPTLMRFGYNAPETDDMNLIGKYQALKSVSYVNATEITNMSKMFMYCSRMTDVTFDNINKNTTTHSMFLGCTYLNTINNLVINNKTTIMYGMFLYCYGLTELDASTWDVSNVTGMADMFFYCTNLTTISGISNWSTDKVTYISRMFKWCESLTTLDLSNWNTENVTDMFEIFRACKKLTSINLSNWNTSKVTNMESMFNSCNNLTTLDISNFVINASTDAYGILTGCNKLSDIGMLYCSQDTINKVIPLITDGSQTIWVKDTKASDYTATDYVTIKDYKEDNKTLYLNSPLLEGDEIVNKEGKLYHYHKMGSVVLDGDEGWGEFKINEHNVFSSYLTARHYNNGNGHLIRNGKIIADIIPTLDIYTANGTQEYIHLRSSGSSGMYISGSISNINPQSSAGINNWLRENPVTVIYELTKPYYELISDDPLIVKSYAEGKLDTSSIISPTSIQSVPYEEELTYLYTSTQYCIQFNSTANCTVDITLGGTKVESKSVSVGLNKIYITTPSELVDNKLIINAKGNATISEVVVVNSNAEFDYFDGLKSSFEDCLVTDVDNENYGKYEVGIKIVGKNKFDGRLKYGYYRGSDGIYIGSAFTSMCVEDFIEVKQGYTYSISVNTPYVINCFRAYDKNKNFVGTILPITNPTIPSGVHYIAVGFRHKTEGIDLSNIDYSTIQLQIEEGTTATSYEPYKETNATIYLNSPLLKGDRIEVKDGKLCHYHKMGSVVLNGSENWDYNGVSSNNTTLANFYSKVISEFVKIPDNPSPILNNKLPFSDGLNQIEGIRLGITTNISININIAKLSTLNVIGLKQWLQNNPITVVYELANPYYEDITPIQSSFVISTVSEGDMEIITDLPIKSNITYLTNITSAVLMEQQLDELDNGTESLTNIVEDEINK